MISATTPNEGYDLAYDEARRALDEQERMVVELRARAGALIAAAAVAASFFGGPLMADGLGLLAWLALLAFAGVGGAALTILWPRKRWTFSLSATQLIATYVEPAAGDALERSMIQRDLALHMDRSAALNHRQLSSLFAVFRLGVFLLLVEVLAWLAVLATQT